MAKTFGARLQPISETFPLFSGPVQDIRLLHVQIGHVGPRRRKAASATKQKDRNRTFRDGHHCSQQTFDRGWSARRKTAIKEMNYELGTLRK
jgi:hypothetical protein